MEIDNLYQSNLDALWDSLLPAPDVLELREDGSVAKVAFTTGQVASHYLANAAKFFAAVAALPFTFVGASLFGRVQKLPSPPEGSHIPGVFGYAASMFQDQAAGTTFDPSSLKGQGVGDWDKVLAREPQRVDGDGRKLLPLSDGITLREGERTQDLFFNMIDHPREFAELLQRSGCTAYRISLERSVLEPERGVYNLEAVQKYRDLFHALKDHHIEPWVTLHHFTNPQWFEELGGFEKEENIEGFVQFACSMAQAFPMVGNWMTFNEPGIRGMEGYQRGEHPPEVKSFPRAAQVIRNLMIAHTRARMAMKKVQPDLNVGFTHQWLKFLPYGRWNLVEKAAAALFTSLAHTPIMGWCKEGKMEIKIPFLANVQLIDRREDRKLADFLGIQAYGFPRVKVGLNGGKDHPGAADKAHNFTPIPGWLGFTAGSTCGEGGTMQYFGPPCSPDDFHEAAREAFSIPEERISGKGVTETGVDANLMKFGEKHFRIDNEAQAEWLKKVVDAWSRYPLKCFFLWTLHRNNEWRSGQLPKLGVTTVRNSEDGSFNVENTPAYQLMTRVYNSWKEAQPGRQEAVA